MQFCPYKDKFIEQLTEKKEELNDKVKSKSGKSWRNLIYHDNTTM